MIFLGFKQRFIENYGENYILDKCREKGCFFKDIRKEDYIILDGDNLEKRNGRSSVDCIIVGLKTNLDNKHNIILCELTSGSKDLKKVRQKFEDGRSLAVSIMGDMGEEINNISCLLLGKIKDNGQHLLSKNLMNPISIRGFERNDIFIRKEECGYSVNNFEVFS